MADAPLLKLTGVTKSFGAQPILKGIDLEVRRGEFLTLLGPSGCGKTTTLRIIAGFEKPDTGSVYLEGAEVTALPPYKRDVHTVFQQYALFPHYNVYDNVAFGLRIRDRTESEIAERVKESLALVKLSGYEQRRITQISGGQQQRVAVARALVGRPSLLLLDEPLGALDLKLRKSMQLELKAIQRQLGLTFIYVTHDQEEALTMSDRIAVFNAGAVVQLGGPREIYDAPRSSFVADFIGAANILEGRLSRVKGGDALILLEEEIEVQVPKPDIDVQEGERVHVAIRPERIEVHFNDNAPKVPGPGTPIGRSASQTPGTRQQASGPLRIPATLKEAVYLGSATQLYVSPFPKTGKTVLATTIDPVDPALQGVAGSGRKVWLTVRPSDILVLDKAPA